MLLDITQEDRQLWVSYFNLDGKIDYVKQWTRDLNE